MAFQTGSQIRPELSAVDYTPFLQASVQGSQMATQGSMAIAKGLEDFATKVVKGIQQKQAEEEGAQLIQKLYPGIDEKTARIGLKSAGGATAFLKFKTDFDRYQKSVSDQAKAADYAQALINTKGAAPVPSGMTNEQVIAGRNQYLDLIKTEAGVLKTGAETKATEALTKQREAETATRTKDESIISKVINDFAVSQNIPSSIRRGAPMTPQDVLVSAAKQGLSSEGLGKVGQLAGALVRTREVGADSPDIAISQFPKESIPVGYDVIPKQDTKTGKWFPDIVQSQALKSLGPDHVLVKDPKTGVPVAKVVPGSATDQKQSDQKKKEDEQLKTIGFHLESDRENALQALWLLRNKGTGGLTAMMGFGPTYFSTNEQSFVRKIEAVRNAAGVNYIMDLKRTSPTGGGPLGTTSDKDFAAIINAAAPIFATDRPENTEAGLLKIIGNMNTMAERVGLKPMSYDDYDKQLRAANLKASKESGKIPMGTSREMGDFGVKHNWTK